MAADWTVFLTPAASVITAGLAAFVAIRFGSIQASIARQQAETAAATLRTARNRLKFDLFDRRMSMYNTVYNYIETVAGVGKLENETDSEFMNQVRAIGWVTDHAVVSYVFTELRAKMLHLSNLTIQIEAAREARTFAHDLLLLQINARIALREQHAKLAEAFHPYLKLEH